MRSGRCSFPILTAVFPCGKEKPSQKFSSKLLQYITDRLLILRREHLLFLLSWCQKAGREEDGLVMWDYHVILLRRRHGQTAVYDLDTRLPFPCDFKLYADSSFGDESAMLPKFHRLFRVVSGEEYLEQFSSNRSHMRKEGGQWVTPPPAWDCIRSGQEEHNLDTFLCMDKSRGPGSVNTLDQLRNTFS